MDLWYKLYDKTKQTRDRDSSKRNIIKVYIQGVPLIMKKIKMLNDSNNDHWPKHAIILGDRFKHWQLDFLI